MRANVWSGRNSVAVEEVPEPRILNRRDAIVKISSTAICGSDLHLYDGYVPTMKRGPHAQYAAAIATTVRTGNRLRAGAEAPPSPQSIPHTLPI